ncbi:MAG: DEAD/DEAH box helicase [archaeon]|nr:DEAD/DEAH box helicase [archaeon]
MSISFETLNVKQEIVKALKEEGIVVPTSIQEKTIPLAKSGKDLIGISRTGSGKTACFGIPLLEKVQKGQGVQGLVLAPTRELADQISKELKKWSKYTDIEITVAFGGVPIEPQERSIARSEIVVGTPGRILDLAQRGSLNLSKLTCFVLDEADKMVEMGFIEDIDRILSNTPRNRQIILFGATISDEIDDLKKNHMNDAVIAETELHVKKDLLKQVYYDIPTHQKFSLLVHLLKEEKEKGQVIIFCSKRSTVELLHKNLRLQSVKADMVHGKMRQTRRLQIIKQFNTGKSQILVASSIAARGLDIRDVTHVFNYDLSQDPQEYVHRVGRTARAGDSGTAITLLSPQDHGTFSAILNKYPIDVQEMRPGDFPKVSFDTGPRRDGRDGRDQGGYHRKDSLQPRGRRY